MAKNMFKILLITLIMFPALHVFAEDSAGVNAASVNGVFISNDDVKREMNMMYQRAVQQGVYPDNSQIEEYWNIALNSLIGRELIYQEAVGRDYSADVDAVSDYINALTMNYGGEENLAAALAQQGMTLEKLKVDTERYYVISSFVDDEMKPKVSISDDECRAYYDENKEYFKSEETVSASHILIKTDDQSDEAQMAEALEKIKGIRERITAGEDFGTLAKEYSDCPSSENGGALGEFGRGMMVPPFDRAVFALEPGELSEPVLTQYGYHIILLTGRNSGGQIAFDDVKQQIAEYLTNRSLETEVNSYVDELRAEADVKLFQAKDASGN